MERGRPPLRLLGRPDGGGGRGRRGIRPRPAFAEIVQRRDRPLKPLCDEILDQRRRLRARNAAVRRPDAAASSGGRETPG